MAMYIGRTFDIDVTIEDMGILGTRSSLDDLPENLVEIAPVPSTIAPPSFLSEVERRHVQNILRKEKGNKVHAAKAVGISRRALYRLISKYRLEGSSESHQEPVA